MKYARFVLLFVNDDRRIFPQKKTRTYVLGKI